MEHPDGTLASVAQCIEQLGQNSSSVQEQEGRAWFWKPPHQLPLSKPFEGNKSGHPYLGEPGFRSSYSLTGGMDPSDNSRKQKPASIERCQICEIDYETVEGLGVHSQTRDHQKAAMNIVLSIK
ncbi:Protein CELLULOSE SYNTHASE INTERACTIVE 1 [Camellia lanceoleosa]|uniref:Protein CELLULOSE SYNTHASE INTERACTIVE 1 n=1 Tax=Camellia lanceoleosa TaxID=1840588 RepID=A0ACC0I1U9_9ERIC|nr:Protein CELLULOSE SYNTHASE INTERACTIVE 1 [Camellia lanceoleosa]